MCVRGGGGVFSVGMAPSKRRRQLRDGDCIRGSSLQSLTVQGKNALFLYIVIATAETLVLQWGLYYGYNYMTPSKCRCGGSETVLLLDGASSSL